MAGKEAKSTQYVIIDSDVIDRFSKDPLGIGDGIYKDLSSAIEAKYSLAYSEVTLFELMDEIPPEDEQRVFDELNGIIPFPVTKEVLSAAGRVGHLYKLDKHPIRDVGDKIIAATAILTNSLVYTLNGRDYPRPFFGKVAHRIIEYEHKDQVKSQVAYFLEPNLNVLDKKINERNAKFKKQIENKIQKKKHAVDKK